MRVRTLASVRFAVAVLLAFAATAPAWAQRSATSDSTDASSVPAGGWISLGVGAGSKGGAAAHFTVSARAGHHLVSLRATGSEEVTFIGEPEPVNDFALLYGRRLSTVSDWTFIAGSVGVAIIRDRTLRQDQISTRTTVGLPLQARIAAQSTVFVGLGINIFANINSVRSFGGVALTVQLGDLR